VRPAPRLGLALAAGALAALGFLPDGLGGDRALSIAALLAGLAALWWLCAAAPRRAGWTGWAWGLAHFALGCHWIAQSFTYQAKMPAWLGWVAVGGLAALLAAMPALTCALAFRAVTVPVARVFAFAAAWMLGEWLRGWILTGFPWNPLAAALLLEQAPGATAAAAYIGALGVSGLVALAGALAGWLAWRRGGWLAAAGALLAALAFALSAPLERTPPPLNPAGPGPDLLIVQPDIGQDEKWAAARAEVHLARLMALSREGPSPRRGVARLILWPEVALPQAEIEAQADLRAYLATLLRPGDLLLLGGLSVERDARGVAVAARNSLFVLDATGAILARYDKHHLVPGGEYVPLKPLADALGLSRLAPGSLGFTPGPGPRTLALPGGLPAVGPMICYEMIFPGRIVERGERRPDWMLNPSNDAWFGAAGPSQHLALARLRAIEEGLPIARSTPTGISALVGPDGMVLAALAQRGMGVVARALPAPRPPTPFARMGHLASLGVALVLAALAALAAWLARRGHGT
jgi:apolipoprotein N-acyltransferase